MIDVSDSFINLTWMPPNVTADKLNNHMVYYFNLTTGPHGDQPGNEPKLKSEKNFVDFTGVNFYKCPVSDITEEVNIEIHLGSNFHYPRSIPKYVKFGVRVKFATYAVIFSVSLTNSFIRPQCHY